MNTMQKNPKTNMTIYDLSYPCYAGPVVEGERIVHIPGQFEYRHLDDVSGYVMEGYKVQDKFYLFDCMTLELWLKQKCFVPYHKRLRTLRTLLNDQIANREKVADLPMVLVDNPIDLADYCDNLLTQGFTKARIMYDNGNYVFGVAGEEYVEIDL